MQSDGSYIRRSHNNGNPSHGLHQFMILKALAATKDAKKLKRRVGRFGA